MYNSLPFWYQTSLQHPDSLSTCTKFGHSIIDIAEEAYHKDGVKLPHKPPKKWSFVPDIDFITPIELKKLHHVKSTHVEAVLKKANIQELSGL